MPPEVDGLGDPSLAGCVLLQEGEGILILTEAGGYVLNALVSPKEDEEEPESGEEDRDPGGDGEKVGGTGSPSGGGDRRPFLFCPPSAVLSICFLK